MWTAAQAIEVHIKCGVLKTSCSENQVFNVVVGVFNLL